MGINAEAATAIAYLRRNAIVPDEILCLGHPETFFSEAELREINSALSLGFSPEEIATMAAEKYTDRFLSKLGFTNVRIMDASDYEGANIVHDLNNPVPEALRGTVRFLYDGGTIEHVFDIATTFKNVIGLLSIGGIVLFASPANSQCGHGFYQFSPELFYRVLQANGFDDVVVYITSTLGPHRWFKAIDPRIAKRRVQFMSSEPLQLIVIAQKARDLPEFINPQQSDYSDIAWTETNDGGAPERQAHRRFVNRFRSSAIYRVAYPLQILLRHMTGFCFGTGAPGLWRKSFFEPIDALNHKLFVPSASEG